MKNKLFLLSSLSLLLLSSCLSYEDTYSRRDYYSPVFEENYYKVKEDNIVSNISSSNNHILDKKADSVFITYSELQALGSDFDYDVANGNVTYDSFMNTNSNTTYGTEKCLGKMDDSFNHGVLSKLTDGLLFCDHITYQGVRVQIDESGFIHEYEKKCIYADYFAMSFKPGSDFTSNLYSSSAEYDIILNVAFYNESDGKFVENIYSYSMNSIIRDKYYLFGFKLTQAMVKDLKGIGISYTLINTNEDPNLQHCLHLYETLFVNSTWY